MFTYQAFDYSVTAWMAFPCPMMLDITGRFEAWEPELSNSISTGMLGLWAEMLCWEAGGDGSFLSLWALLPCALSLLDWPLDGWTSHTVLQGLTKQAMCATGPGWSQEPSAFSRSPAWVTAVQTLGSFWATFPMPLKGISRTQTGAHLGSWHHRRQTYVLCHNS